MSYFCFPLYLLTYEKDPKERIQHIVSYSTREVGRKQQNEIDGRRLDELINNWCVQSNTAGFNKAKPDHIAVLVGANILNVNTGHFDGSCTRAKNASYALSDLESKWGTSPLVFIGSSLLWGCHDADNPPWREFSVLCAVSSCLGQKQTPMRITREMIIPRQLGYKSAAMMKSHVRLRADKARPLTVQQLRSTLDSLEQDGLIHRVHASRRWTYFRRTDAEGAREGFIQQVAAMIEKRKRVANLREQDRKLFQQNNTRTKAIFANLRRSLGENH